MRIHRRWPIDWLIRPAPGISAPSALLVPEFPIPRGMPAEAAALLPNIAYNQSLMESLTPRAIPTATPEVATVFAADPFLNVPVFAGELQRRGIARLTNLPTISQFGAEFSSLADGVGVGAEIEFARLRQFADMGFEVFASVTHADQATAALDAGAVVLIAILDADGSVAVSDRPARLRQLCVELNKAVPRGLPILALTGERMPGFKAAVAGTIRYAA